MCHAMNINNLIELIFITEKEKTFHEDLRNVSKNYPPNRITVSDHFYRWRSFHNHFFLAKWRVYLFRFISLSIFIGTLIPVFLFQVNDLLLLVSICSFLFFYVYCKSSDPYELRREIFLNRNILCKEHLEQVRKWSSYHTKTLGNLEKQFNTYPLSNTKKKNILFHLSKKDKKLKYILKQLSDEDLVIYFDKFYLEKEKQKLVERLREHKQLVPALERSKNFLEKYSKE
jgi:hypothetical protein